MSRMSHAAAGSPVGNNATGACDNREFEQFKAATSQLGSRRSREHDDFFARNVIHRVPVICDNLFLCWSCCYLQTSACYLCFLLSLFAPRAASRLGSPRALSFVAGTVSGRPVQIGRDALDSSSRGPAAPLPRCACACALCVCVRACVRRGRGRAAERRLTTGTGPATNGQSQRACDPARLRSDTPIHGAIHPPTAHAAPCRAMHAARPGAIATRRVTDGRATRC